MIAGIHRIGVTESMLKGKQGYGRCYMRRFEENQVSEKNLKFFNNRRGKQ